MIKKKLTPILVAVIICMLFTGCGASNKSADTATAENANEKLVEVYISNAQKLMDSGEYEAAKAILEEGIKNTNDDTLADMLGEILIQQSTLQQEITEEHIEDLNEGAEAPSTESIDDSTINDITLENQNDEHNTTSVDIEGSILDYWDYNGIWATQGFGWEIGGVMLDITIENDQMWLRCQIVQAYPQSRASVIEKSGITIEDIIDDTITIDFEDDGWGNKGTLQVKFADNSVAKTVECTILNLEYVGEMLPVWGEYDGQYILALNWDAKDALKVPEYMLETDVLNPEDDMAVIEPEFDILYSTASEYLAYIDMTEEEFKASCNTLVSYNTDFEYVNKTGKALYTCENIESYPNDYVGMAFKYCVAGDKSFYSDDTGKSIQELLSVKSAGIIIDAKESEKQENGEILAIYQLQPVYYYMRDTTLFLGLDSRDDIYSPKITAGNHIDECYMIFLGVEPLGEYDAYLFKLISFEVQ